MQHPPKLSNSYPLPKSEENITSDQPSSCQDVVKAQEDAQVQAHTRVKVKSRNENKRTCVRNLKQMVAFVRFCYEKSGIIIRQIIYHTVSLKRNAIASFLSVLICMTLDLYPSTPRYNMGLAVFCLLLQVSKQQRCQSKKFYVIFAFALVVSVTLDLDWAFSNYYPAVLSRKFGKDEEIGFPLQFTNFWYVSLVGIISNIFLKVILFHTISKKTRSGRRLTRNAWQYVHLFCPSMMGRLPKNLSRAIQRRIFSIVWIEIFCTVAILSLFIVVHTRMSWASQFSVNCPLIPLKMIMLLKGCTSGILALCLLSTADIPDFLAEYGCMVSKTWYENRKRIENDKNSLEIAKVIVDKKYIVLNICAKLIDITIGCLTWVALSWAYSLGGKDTPKDIRLILTILIIVQFFTEILVSALCITVYWFVIIRKQAEDIRNSEENRTSFRDELDRSDNDVESSLGPSSSDRSSDSENDPISHSSLNMKKQADYDLSTSVQKSQNVFEMRMIKAQSPAKNLIRLNQSNNTNHELDLCVACGPEEFSIEWESLELGFNLKCTTEKMPLMREFHDHFKQNRIFIIASGVVGDGVMKLFLIAQHLGSRCLMELEFNPSNRKLVIQFKASNANKIPHFLKCLHLRTIFGDY